jgi:hypothetical protein
LLLAVTSPVQHKNQSKKKAKAPRVLDRTKALVITEKRCYIACINSCYENPSLDPSRPDLSLLDCLAAGRPLPCSLCLARRTVQVDTLVFSPSPFPAGLAPLPVLTAPQAISRSSTSKKDTKLKKKEREAAEKHLLKFGESIRQLERWSDNHAYRPRSSIFPSRILSLILNALLTIHFPSDLDDILNDSWAYYSSYGPALFDSVLQIQTSITVLRNTVRELTLTKQRTKRQATRAIGNNDSGALISSDSDAEPSQETVEEPPVQYLDNSLGRKRQALEEMTNTAKRRRAPRAAQPSVSQVLEDFGPRYRTRGSAPAEGSSGGGDGKENGGLRRSKRI